MKWEKVGNLSGKRGENGKDAIAPDTNAVAAEVLAKFTKALEALPVPKDGKDADPEFVRSLVQDEVSRAVKALPPAAAGKDGASVDLVELSGEIMAAAAKAVAALPVPKDGRDFDPLLLKAEVERAVAALPPAADAEVVHELVERAVNAIPRPQDGRNADPLEIEGAIAAEVQRALSALPKPHDGERGADGKSLTLDDIRPMFEAEVARGLLDLERRGADVLQRAIDRMPVPKDGADGLGFDDLEVTQKNHRTLVMAFRRGQTLKAFEFTFPVMLDAGVFELGKSYEEGDAPTYGGSIYVAQRKTLPTERPGDGSDAFRLAVKRGKDGKDGA